MKMASIDAETRPRKNYCVIWYMRLTARKLVNKSEVCYLFVLVQQSEVNGLKR